MHEWGFLVCNFVPFYCARNIIALNKAQERGKPEIFNTDQGCQFTSKTFLAPLKDRQSSMDGRDRALDNIFGRRFWQTLKYEWLYLNDYERGIDLSRGLRKYLNFYNGERLLSSLGYRTPQEIHFEDRGLSRLTFTTFGTKMVLTMESTLE